MTLGTVQPVRFVSNPFAADAHAGDAAYFTKMLGRGRPAGLNFRCPGCGWPLSIAFEPSDFGPSWKWDGNREAPTLSPEIRHTSPNCNWRGWLKLGQWIT